MNREDLDSYLVKLQGQISEEADTYIRHQDLHRMMRQTDYVYRIQEQQCFPNNEKLVFSLHPYLPLNESVTKSFHCHNFIEMIYVYSGTCYQYIGDELVTLPQGSLCILDTNVVHFIYTKSKDDLVVNCLMRKAYFDSAFLVRLKGNDIFQNFLINAVFQSKSSNNYIVFHSNDNRKAHETICNILCEYYDPKVCSSELIDSYMIILFAELLRIYNSGTPSRNWMTFQQTEVSGIIDYIYKNYKTISLKTAAEHFNLTEKYLSSKIRKQSGYTFMEIVHQIRMEQACNLLLYTYLPVEQVACEVGYSNINFFYQLFKRSFGITPKIYQQLHEGIKI